MYTYKLLFNFFFLLIQEDNLNESNYAYRILINYIYQLKKWK